MGVNRARLCDFRASALNSPRPSATSPLRVKTPRIKIFAVRARV